MDKPPFATRKVLVKPESRCMDEGRELYQKALDIYAEYRQIEGKYPGYPLYNTIEKE
jgi:hypothetical protein